MPENETTTKFKVDISELKKAMQEAKRSVAVANSEFKAVSSSMDDWTKSSEGISAKLTQLSSNLKAQRTILSSLEAQYEAVVREQGEGSKAADDLRIKINNQKAVINNTEKEISKYNDALTEVVKAEKTAAKTGQEVAEVLEDMGKEAESAEDGFTVLKGTIATFAGNVLTSLVGSVKNAASSLLGLGEATKEYRNQMNKLESASEDAGYSVDYAKEKYTDLYSVLADETASNTAVSNFMAIGASEKTLNSLLDSSIGIWAKFGDSIPLDGLAEAINHTGKLGSVQGNLADALEWSGITVDDFNAELEKCNTEQQRQELIADTLNGLYGDLSKSYKSNNKSIIEANKANAAYTDTVAEMGAKIEPVTTAVRNGFNGVLEKIMELIGDVDMSGFTSAIESAFKVLIDDVLPAVKNGFGWIIDNKDVIVAGLAAIAAGFIAFKVASIIQAATAAMQGMTIAQYALNLAMSLNPIGIVISLIAALVAAIVVLWNKSEDFRNFFINLWEGIKNTIGVVVDAIAGFFSDLWTGIQSIWSTVSTWFNDNVIQPLKDVFSPIVEWFTDLFMSIYNTLSDIVSNIIAIVRGVWLTIKAIFEPVFKWFNDNIIQPVSKVFSGLWNGLKDGAKAAWNGIKSVFSSVANFFGNIFSEAWSKVKAVFSIGGKIFDGIKDGIVSAFKTIVNGIIKGINKVVAVPFDGINWALKKIKGISIMGIKPFDWISTIGVPQIPLLAKGGIVSRATQAIIGEAGKEAVLPLEKNTGWMRQLAADLVREMGLGVVNNSSTSVGNTTVHNHFNQTINSPKQLSRVELYRQTKNLLGYAGGGR